MKRTLYGLFSGMLCMAAVTAGGSEIEAGLSTQLKRLAPGDRIAVLVSFHEPLETRQFRSGRGKRSAALIAAMKTKASRNIKRVQPLLKRIPANRVRTLWINNSIALEADGDLIKRLADHPAVISVRTDSIVTLEEPLSPPAAAFELPDPLERVGAAALWELGVTGSGVVVASMDTGVDLNHPDLSGRWRGGENSWKDVYGQYLQPFDYDGHGTAVMGLILGGNASGGFIGAAPDAQWIAVKIFNDLGQSSYSRIHEAFQWLLDPDGDPNTPDAPDIVNGSWGLTKHVNQCVPEFYGDVEALRSAGIIVVFAAGNGGPATATSISPANYDNGLSVGAVDDTDRIAYFSSRGPSACGAGVFPLITAPGMNLITTDLTGGGVIPYSYTSVYGTSFAAPLVSGSLALLISEFPDMDPARLEEVVLLSAVDLGTPGPDNEFGCGMIRADEAYWRLRQTLCPSDINRDGAVDLEDVSTLSAQWMDCRGPDCSADLNRDGVVNFRDLAQIAKDFGLLECVR